MGWESFGVIGFDLWPLFQDQMGIPKISVYRLRLSNVRMALVSFLLVDTICIGSPM